MRAKKCTPAWPYSRLHPGVSQLSRAGAENWRIPIDAAGTESEVRAVASPERGGAIVKARCGCGG